MQAFPSVASPLPRTPYFALSRGFRLLCEHLEKERKGNGYYTGYIELEAFDQEPNLCVIPHLKAYVDDTSVHKGDTNRNQLLLSFQKPFKPVSMDTISQWIRNVFKDVGIDTTKFGAHSTRAASTSAAAKAGKPIEVILKSAGWSNWGIFAKFFQKPINAPCNMGSFC